MSGTATAPRNSTAHWQALDREHHLHTFTEHKGLAQTGARIIVKADGVTVAGLARLRDLVNARKPGDTMTLEIFRGDKKMTVEVKLGRQPTSPSG